MEEEYQPKLVEYCQICTFPYEYCEFNSKFKKCKDWLYINDHDRYLKMYGDNEKKTEIPVSTLSQEKQNKIHDGLIKKQKKEELRESLELKKKLQSIVVITRIERNKRKHVISISGLDVFDFDIKKLSKTFATKFATGSSIVKNNGKSIIQVQGDVGNEAKEHIKTLLTEKGLDNVKIVIQDEKKVSK